MTAPPSSSQSTIKPIDSSSIHRINSGQVVIDLQTAVKELLENSLDAGATNIEVRFKDSGLKSVEVVDNGSGIAPEDYENVALPHHTSKLSSTAALSTLSTFGFRGEALSSLCSLCESVVVTTATANEAPMGCVLEMDRRGKVVKKGRTARQRGTTIVLTNIFASLPVRRKELERNVKREFAKTLNLLNAYALVPCSCAPSVSPDSENLEQGKPNRGVRLTISNHPQGGKKGVLLRTDGSPSLRSSVSSLWGPKSLENVIDLNLKFDVEPERAVLRRMGLKDSDGAPKTPIEVHGLISKFSVGCGRTGTDRQFFYVNGRPWNAVKVQKAFNEVYRSFNISQAPFVVADFIIPTDACDINVSPDKRTIFLHSEGNLIEGLKAALEAAFSSSRSTFDVTPASSSHIDGKVTRDKRRASQVDVGSRLDGREDGDSETGADENGEGSVGGVDVGERMGEPHLLIEEGDHPVGLATSPKPLQPTDNPAEQRLGPEMEVDEGPPATSPASVSSRSISHPPIATHSPQANSSSPIIPREASRRTSSRLPSTPPPSPYRSKSQPSLKPASSKTNAPHEPTPSQRRVSVSSSPEVQAVVSTRGAFWNIGRRSSSIRPGVISLDRDDAGEAEADAEVEERGEELQGPVKKKPRLSSAVHVRDNEGGDVDGGVGRKGKEGPASARQSLRAKLVGFASSGSQIEVVDLVDEDMECDGEVESVGKSTLEPDEEVENASDLASRRGSVDDDSAIPSVQESTSSNPLFIATTDSDMEVDTDLPTDGPPTVPRIKIEECDHEHTIDLTQPQSPVDHSHPLPLPSTSSSQSDSIDVQNSAGHLVDQSTVSSNHSDAVRSEIVKTFDTDGDVAVGFDIAAVSSRWAVLRDNASSITLPAIRPGAGVGAGGDASVHNVVDDAKAVDALSRIIEKKDFLSMEVVGQFNLGFIIARRRQHTHNEDGEAVSMDDLFIIDQHAADEKYNFETLQQTTRIQSQKLFRPQPLEFTAADELVAIEKIDVLRQNGFEIDVDEEAPSGQGRLKLTARPVSKSTVFDMKDLEELLHLMQDSPAGRVVRCSKARAMFASRACRKSVMIGMPLTKKQMTTVIRHMGTMDQPWNCPHGRPTMRHLSDISDGGFGFGSPSRSSGSREVDWSSFGLEIGLPVV
ncbi:hypothetical protein JAAARDRAFT_73425 [Jaapia argillacea MUCL 33604]|uniref:DNA mismatch repair protein S5 domain-containing protein n=1 Tax=Jaapia argillacea MUCL 33604 TaxID=933084 RepID=A0A067PD50_9AGAM|nr:hypothetical protein JAAARDRAFT_73425 [Jaapia argillacea MUCL 33604]